jgi:hypothetical protein
MNETVTKMKIDFAPPMLVHNKSILKNNILNTVNESDTKIHLKVPKENYGRWSKEEH